MPIKNMDAPLAEMPAAKKMRIQPPENSSPPDMSVKIVQLSSIILRKCEELQHPLTYDDLFYSPWDACGIVIRTLPHLADDSLDSTLWRSYFMSELRPRLQQTDEKQRSKAALANLLSQLIFDVTGHMGKVQDELNLRHRIDYNFIMKKIDLIQMK